MNKNSELNLSEEEINNLSINVADRISKKEKLNDLFGIQNRDMSYLYESAVYSYNSGKYEEALRTFTMLLTFDRNNSLYEFGYAACMQALKNYPVAIEFYAEIGKKGNFKENVDLEIAKCFLGMGNKNMAKLAIEHAENNPENQEQTVKNIEAVKALI